MISHQKKSCHIHSSVIICLYGCWKHGWLVLSKGFLLASTADLPLMDIWSFLCSLMLLQFTLGYCLAVDLSFFQLHHAVTKWAGLPPISAVGQPAPSNDSCDNKPPGSQHGPKGDLESKLELLFSWPCPTTLLAVLVGPYWHGASPQESPTESQTGSRKSHSPFNLPVYSHCPHQESNTGNHNTLLPSFLILSLCLSPQSHN